LWQRDGVAGAALAAAEGMGEKGEIGPHESWGCGLDGHCTFSYFGRFCRPFCLGAGSCFTVLAGSPFPFFKPWAARLGIRCLDSVVCYQHPRRGAVLARLCPASSGVGHGPGSVAGERNSMVLVPLEFWLADLGDVAADHLTAAVDCSAQAEHLGGNHHSRGVQRRRFRSCHPQFRHPIGSAALKTLKVDLGMGGVLASDFAAVEHGKAASNAPVGTSLCGAIWSERRAEERPI